MGVANVIFCNANKVQQDYFGSHLLRPPMSKMRQALKEGLEQAGETYLPKVHVAKRLKYFLEEQLDQICPDTIRMVGHPQKSWLPPLPPMRDVQVPPNGRILVGVGPEAGWQDPYELELLGEHGFQGISLGPRTYRTEVALISLLALANERLEMADLQEKGRR
uniref:16S rRNA (uracil(1498)-N(3))-methyltransferase n=2 Tax=Guillardia theta TaxID=55529 RepID=A0A7S4KNT6_GUITH|mmetsp:Transcript_28158/g.91271  ORF Transcript_28158/g.91271 Transcript_28158/m.91271 type:complete len:163 (+) Transcript_28158:647-1135(+)